MSGEARCASCGHELRDGIEAVTVRLPRCGVVASAVARAQLCAGCGAVQMDDDAARQAQLAIGCALADRGVQTGDALRHMRTALRLRAVDLARLLGVTPETVSHWETGRPARAAFVAVAAMIDDVLAGRSTTRDRLAALAEGRPYPRALSAAAPARERAAPLRGWPGRR
jgi:transcriptional regulator with XRE-family HTH domain/predicted RNA-binding Zn-ribbon protein involved in translation (DUF1610 family)